MTEDMQQLLHLLSSRSRAETDVYIAQKLHMELSSVQALLQEGLADAAIVCSQKGRYSTPEQMGLIACRVRPGGSLLFGTPIDKEQKDALQGDIRLDMKGDYAWPDDIVLVRVTAQYPKARGDVVSVARRAHTILPAMLIIPPKEEPRKLKGRAKSRPRKPRFAPEIIAVPENPSIRDKIVIEGDTLQANNADLVLVRIRTYPKEGKRATGTVQEVIGSTDSIQSTLQAIAASHGFTRLFPDDAAAQADAIPEELQPSELSGRRDLRNLTLFTIDGADAQDFDDAVSLQKTETGWELGVHIADVSHYVSPQTPIDKEAFSRTTSLYLPGLTFPMLPEALSNNLCSLMPNVDRLTLSCIMQLQGAEVVSYEIVPSVIRSSARLLYSAVNAFFEGKENSVPQELHKQLTDMLALSKTIRRAREARGAIEFDLPEPEFLFLPDGEPKSVHARERGDAEKLIEDFMLTANETVARFARENEIPIAYRVHEPPDPDAMASIATYLEALEIPTRLEGSVAPGTIANLLESVKGTAEEKTIHSAMLRAMRKAEYNSMPHGHFALAARDYCHFTSPIRRYPDLAVHRSIKAFLQGQETDEWIAAQTAQMPEIASHCSHGEYAAVQAEREGDDRMRARYMARHIGKRFHGSISGVTQSSIFVSLPNTAEGRIPLSTLDEPYEYVEEMRCLVGEYTNSILRVGLAVEVRLEHVDERTGYIEFSLWRIPQEVYLR